MGLVLEGFIVDRIQHSGMILRETGTSYHTPQPHWQLGLRNSDVLIDETIDSLDFASFLHLIEDERFPEDILISSANLQCTDDPENILRNAHYRRMEWATDMDNGVGNDAITEAWNLTRRFAQGSPSNRPMIEQFVETITSGTTIGKRTAAVDMLLHFAKDRFSMVSGVLEGVGSGKSLSKSVRDCLRSKGYLDSAVEASLLYNERKRSVEPDVVINRHVQNGFRNLLSSFHSNNANGAKDAVKALATATSRHDEDGVFNASFVCGGVGKRFVITKSGRMALTHPQCRRGHVICVLFGGVTPFILRPTPDSPNSYVFLGQCYVDDLMDGRVIKQWEAGEIQVEKLRLS
ncbi:hypothetical protein BFJ68_g16591 [Fusarium oxysporum]|uniref:Heterokaryon incompatibility domain-containing protein n=1 Tax=Fusarium oxysporum TaxID=5507 RepID=A0A420PBR2_FUSOX|nr:hypothetical protein BFJ71_g15713 [Fusarium oxysporum]RKK89944.1 hypothetical protein BFJ68_g16591 [Fusarium oxysporum]